MKRNYPDPAPDGFQARVNSAPRRGPIVKLRLTDIWQIGNRSFYVARSDGDLVSVKLSDGTTATLRVPAILF